MKHVLLALTVVSLTLGVRAGVQASAAAVGPKLDGQSIILTDAVTGQVLYARNAYVRRPVASTTKIMTAILVIENCGMDEIVTASEAPSKVPYTSLHLKPGEQVKVEDLLVSLMVRSANDVAVALAEHVGGTVSGFAQMMNDKAREIGAKNTHFVTPNGLYAPGHYSTAYDLALIARYALRLPHFNEIIATQSKKIKRSINTKDVLIQTRSKFIKHYLGADGIKSGYTKQSGYCYVGSATRGGWRLVSVVLDSFDSQADTAALMDYGFKHFQRVLLARRNQPVATVQVYGGSSELEVVPERQVHVTVKAGQADMARAETKIDQLRAPVKKGEKVGTMTAYVADKPVMTVDLNAAEDVDETSASAAWPWVRAIALLTMISIGAACGRAVAKGPGGGWGGLS
ncbi:MAG: D-alanyl-D-alanine carboxypeptidase [Armatimonadetes bacterium]|nr:D-alanyl-D-alanine carboxypeptidase [Armatimonadota bacterium]